MLSLLYFDTCTQTKKYQNFGDTITLVNVVNFIAQKAQNMYVSVPNVFFLFASVEIDKCCKCQSNFASGLKCLPLAPGVQA